jgi:beta-glucosidase
LLITENGLADAEDTQREWWIRETAKGVNLAQDNGVELLGYLHWSLLDNFEWAYGWWPEFGLVHVDRKTMKRTIRPSAKQLAKIIEQKQAS